MEWFHATLLTMAAIAVALAWRVPNAAFFVALGVISYVSSAAWHNMGFPYATLYGAFTNLVICCVIYRSGIDVKWEAQLMACFVFMLLIDLLFVVGIIKSQYNFAVSLELANAYALLLISATGIAERIGNGRRFSHPYRDLLDSFNRSVFAESKQYPRWWRHR
jgi:hypothetical protein